MRHIKGIVRLAVLVAAASIMAAGGPAAAAVRTWDGIVDNDWFRASNWTPAGPPASSDDLYIYSGSPQTVSFVTADSGGSITFDGPTASGTFGFAFFPVGRFGSGALSITNGGQVANHYGYVGDEAGSSGTATVAGGTWTNSHYLHVGHHGAGVLTISNGGQVENTLGTIGYFAGATGTVTVDNATWTNSGSLYVGRDGSGALSISNGGQVANSDGYIGVGAGSTGTVTVDNATWTNSGSLHVGYGGAGALTISSGGQVNVGYTLKVWGPGTVNLNGGELSVDDLTGQGTFRFDRGTLRLEGGEIGLTRGLNILGDGTLRGQGVVSSRATGSPAATIVAEGDFALGDASLLNGFNHAGALSVGAHTVTLNSSGFAGLGVLTSLAGGTLEAPNGVALGVGDNLEGYGPVNAKIAAGFGSTIRASGGDLTLGDAASPAGFASDGELRVSTQTVTIHDANHAVLGTLTTMGEGATGGTLSVPNGSLLDFGKSLDGFGTVNGAFVNHGDVYGGTGGNTLEFMDPVTGVGDFHNSVTFSGGYSPGLSPIEADLDDVTFSATNTLSIELGGLSPGSDFDKLNISGAATLDGTLAISLIDSFEPAAGDAFTVLTYGSRAGEFATITGWENGGLAHLAIYGANDLTLHCTYFGDATLDGCVDGLDYVVWSNNYLTGDTWQEGDLNGDGITDGLDYVVWSNNYLQGCPGTPGAVPEPSSALLLALGLLALRRRFRA